MSGTKLRGARRVSNRCRRAESSANHGNMIDQFYAHSFK